MSEIPTCIRCLGRFQPDDFVVPVNRVSWSGENTMLLTNQRGMWAHMTCPEQGDDREGGSR